MSAPTHKPEPYGVLPYGAEAEDSGQVRTLTRYYCAAPVRWDTGQCWLWTMTYLRATYERALTDLEGARKDAPKANVTPCTLVFNLAVPEQRAAFEAMQAEAEQERREMGP